MKNSVTVQMVPQSTHIPIAKTCTIRFGVSKMENLLSRHGIG